MARAGLNVQIVVPDATSLYLRGMGIMTNKERNMPTTEASPICVVCRGWGDRPIRPIPQSVPCVRCSGTGHSADRSPWLRDPREG